MFCLGRIGLHPLANALDALSTFAFGSQQSFEVMASFMADLDKCATKILTVVQNFRLLQPRSVYDPQPVGVLREQLDKHRDFMPVSTFLYNNPALKECHSDCQFQE